MESIQLIRDNTVLGLRNPPGLLDIVKNDNKPTSTCSPPVKPHHFLIKSSLEILRLKRTEWSPMPSC